MLKVTIKDKKTNPVSCGRPFSDGDIFEDYQEINPLLTIGEIKERLRKHPEIEIEEIKPKKQFVKGE